MASRLPCAGVVPARREERAPSPARSMLTPVEPDAIQNFWRLFGAPVPGIWFSRGKSRVTAAVYGTEGHRFESCRARSRTPVNAGVLLVLTFGPETEGQVVETPYSSGLLGPV